MIEQADLQRILAVDLRMVEQGDLQRVVAVGVRMIEQADDLTWGQLSFALLLFHHAGSAISKKLSFRSRGQTSGLIQNKMAARRACFSREQVSVESAEVEEDEGPEVSLEDVLEHFHCCTALYFQFLGF